LKVDIWGYCMRFSSSGTALKSQHMQERRNTRVLNHLLKCRNRRVCQSSFPLETTTTPPKKLNLSVAGVRRT
jgi:hypothetical protein